MGDRKYRHQGYQDSGGFDKKSGPRTPRTEMPPRPQRLEGAPRGRSAGGPGPEVFKCSHCGEPQRGMTELVEESVCQCGTDLHVCRNCTHFDTSTLWECRENIPARVAKKDVRNSCALFSPRIVRDLAADKVSKSQPAPDDARKAFEDLFKK